MLRAALIVLVACKGSPSASAPPSATPPIDHEMCATLSAARHTHCGTDQQGALAQCMSYARLAEAGSCVTQAQRSYDCGARSVASCSDKDCCASSVHACDEIDVAFSNCLAGYCGGHAANPDCAILPAGSGT
jgi:hypothetical protein